jgi:hypothetical protein
MVRPPAGSDPDVQSFASIAALRAACVTGRPAGTIVHVTSYDGPAWMGGGGLFSWAPTSSAKDNGGTVIMPACQAVDRPGRWLRIFDGAMNIRWFGAAGDGRTDDTAAVQGAIDATQAGGALLFPPGSYAITMLRTHRSETTWYFDHAELIGRANTKTPCILLIEGLHSQFFNLKINGDFNDNYACALWWYNADSPSQHIDIHSLEIRYARRGIVYGAMSGQTSTQAAQSENVIFGYHTRGVAKPILINHRNGVLFLNSPQLVAHDEEWERDRPGAFDRNANFAFEAVAGTLVVTGGEVQNSIAATGSFCALVDGGEVHLDNCIVEVSTPFYVHGRLAISGGRILNTQSMTSQFLVHADVDTETDLRVSSCRMLRNPNTGSFSDRPLAVVEGIARNLAITFNDCEIDEWASFTPMVLGANERVRLNRCRWRPRGLASQPYRIDTGASDLLENRGIDRAARSLRGYWPQGTSTSRRDLSPDTPAPTFASSLSVRSTNGPAGLFTIDPASLQTVQDTAIDVRPGDRFLVEGWVRSAAGNTASLSMVLFDEQGRSIRVGDDGFLAICDTHQNFIAPDWRYLRQIVEIPSGAAAFAGVGAHVRDGEVRFCGLQVRRADL